MALNSSDVKREGFFRVADAFMRMTTLTWQCYNMTVLVEYTLTHQVTDNLLNPIAILYNAAYQFFFIVSDLFAEFSNIIYQDWMSLCYWFGDLLYRTLVITGTP